ncbi:hypothetical protein C3B51_17875 [Pseudoalteromonas rubra]|uniref:Uncharacterized protein n=1 Tax=Pseudoalteromonas rubra TaxID=43658 RepID=A0A4Q7E745_9GAMM|nr:hypothetical protein [Pseudoalteromonas rubra]RZM76434.1 hypothetical protein C3B51_17875 [Pseudoalteromonas rubra]
MKLNNAEEVLEKLRVLYECKTLTELSRKFGKNTSWAAQAKKNNAIPYSECAQACIEFGVSMDWFLFEKNTSSLKKKEVLNEVQDGLFEAQTLEVVSGLSAEQIKVASTLVLKRLESKIMFSD